MARQSRSGSQSPAPRPGGRQAARPVPGHPPRPEGAGQPAWSSRTGWLVVGALLTLVGLAYGFRGPDGPSGPTPSPAVSAEAPQVGSGEGQLAIVSVAITPASPSRLDTATAVAEVAETGREGVTLHYRWTVNGTEVPEPGPTLPLAAFVPGDVLAVQVTPAGPAGAGLARSSAPVSVANHPPEVTALAVEPPVPRVGEPVRVRVETSDAEQDPVTYLVEWLVDGRVVADVQGPELPGSRVASGARIQAVVTPEDRYSLGAQATSPVIVVSNRPPEIRSVPPGSLAGSSYVYRIVAADPDGDPLGFVLEQGPDGMAVHRTLGVVEWTPAGSAVRSAKAVVRVEDGKGGVARQRLEIAVRPGL